VSAFVNLSRVAGGFSVGYFQQRWGAASGFDLSVGIQVVIVAVATGILTCLYVFGERLRVERRSSEIQGLVLKKRADTNLCVVVRLSRRKMLDPCQTVELCDGCSVGYSTIGKKSSRT
jgi:hypothetical protein